MCISLIFNDHEDGSFYTILYSLQVVQPSRIPWISRLEYFLILRVNKPPEKRPYQIGIYFPFKTGEGTLTAEERIPMKYFHEDMIRENYLNHLFEKGFEGLDTIRWVLDFDDESSKKFRKKLEELYNSKDCRKKYMDDVKRTLSPDEKRRWQTSIDPKQLSQFESRKCGTVLWVRFGDESLLQPGATVILKVIFPRAEAEHTPLRFWAGRAVVMKYPYGHFEHNLCGRDNIISVLYYRFKFYHRAYTKFEDDKRMEVRPPFLGLGSPTTPEGKKFARERNLIAFNLGKELPRELPVSWYSRPLEILVPILAFLIGLLFGNLQTVLQFLGRLFS